MPRMSVDTEAFSDWRFERLGQVLGIDAFSAFGRALHVWHFGTCQLRDVLTAAEIDGTARLEWFAAAMITAQLAESVPDGGIRIKGLSERMEWLAQKRATSSSGGRQAQARLSPEERAERARTAARARWDARSMRTPLSIDAESMRSPLSIDSAFMRSDASPLKAVKALKPLKALTSKATAYMSDPPGSDGCPDPPDARMALFVEAGSMLVPPADLVPPSRLPAAKVPRAPKAPKLSDDQLMAAVDVWNANRGSLRKCLYLTDKRRPHVAARLIEEPDLAIWEAATKRVAASPFCRGETGGHWVATFDWFIKPDSMIKILEGQYDGKKESVSGARTPSWKSPL